LKAGQRPVKISNEICFSGGKLRGVRLYLR
jgi:hypothetical protein